MIVYGTSSDSKESGRTKFLFFDKETGIKNEEKLLPHLMKDEVLNDRFSSLMFFYLVESESKVDIFRFSFWEKEDRSMTGVGFAEPSELRVKDSYNEICPKQLRIHPSTFDELWILSKCENQPIVVSAFDYSENPSFESSSKSFKFKNKDQRVDFFCPALKTVLYVNSLDKKVWM